MKPLISVIVPIYSVEKYLHRCINSIIGQTYKNIEIILVDDGSPDNCPAICDDYAEKYEKIKVVHKQNAGSGFARNSGIQKATGEYIAFVDSDDYVEQDMYQKLIESLTDGVDTVFCGNIDVYGKSRTACRNPLANKKYYNEDVISKVLSSMLGPDKFDNAYAGMSACLGLYSKQLIEENNIRFDSERKVISEDAVFNIKYMSVAKGVNILEYCGYNYCHHNNSITTTYRSDRIEGIVKLYSYELDLVKNLDDYTILKERIQNTLLANARVCIKHEIKFNAGKNGSGNIKQLLNNSIFHQVMNEFDYGNLPFKQKVFCKCARNKSVLMCLIIARLQLYLDKNNL